MVTDAPRGPTESDAPDLLMFMRTPGKSVMRFENLKPMIPPLIRSAGHKDADDGFPQTLNYVAAVIVVGEILRRSEEHTSELQSLMRISYAVFCLKKNKNQQ